ncbi:hypothetical protein JTB14_000750 [Gonioctena quinquepunctata]|nr:hypothetical protein JTB14_000750 [Gonioctena quinquepunctata]
MMSQEEVTSLNRKRGFVKGRKTLFKNYLLDLKNRILTEVIDKIEKKEIDLMKEFDELQDALEKLSDDVDENEQSEFENVYHDLNSEAKIVLETYHATTIIIQDPDIHLNSSNQN